MDDCKSVADPKLATVPILYLPKDVPNRPKLPHLKRPAR
jgi:hypothetical protein